MKAQDCPKYLRPFNDNFNKLDRWSSDTVWSDFLNLSIAGLAYGEKQHIINDILSKYKDSERKILWQLFIDIVAVYTKANRNRIWIDPLGDYYEVLSSKGNKQQFGQFFTPKPICDAMAKITMGDCKVVGKTVIDPASGSGRLLLAINSQYPQNLLFGCDLDKTCVLMTALNLSMQGACGEVCWKDALDVTDHRLVYLINPRSPTMPLILEIPKEKSFIYACDIAKTKPI